MPPSPRVFVDTNVLFAAALSATGGSRALLKAGEVGAITIVVGPHVLAEADAVVARKAPDARPTLVLLLDRARAEVGPHPQPADLALARSVTTYEPDARIVAEALAARVDFLASLDRVHIVGPAAAAQLPVPVGTPGDCLSWLRGQWGGTR
jgi:uncharacterized protein